MKIEGQIVDQKNQPLAGVNVEFYDGGTVIAGARSGSDGRFKFENDAPFPGRPIQAKASVKGYLTNEQSVATDGVSGLTFVMQPERSSPPVPIGKYLAIAGAVVLLLLLIFLVVRWQRGGTRTVSGNAPAILHIQSARLIPNVLVLGTQVTLSLTIVNSGDRASGPVVVQATGSKNFGRFQGVIMGQPSPKLKLRPLPLPALTVTNNGSIPARSEQEMTFGLWTELRGAGTYSIRAKLLPNPEAYDINPRRPELQALSLTAKE